MQQHFNYLDLRRRRKKGKVGKEKWDYSWKLPPHGKGNSKIQEDQRIPYRKKPRRNTPRYILINITKTKHKERILKAVRVKWHIIYKGNPIHLTADLSAESLQDRREWLDIFNIMKGKILQEYCNLQGFHSKFLEK